MAVLYQPENVNRVYYGTDTRAFAFLLGIYLGLREEDWLRAAQGKGLQSLGMQVSLPAQVLFAAALVIMVGMFYLVNGESRWLYQGGMALICLGFGAMILVMDFCLQRDGTMVEKLVHLPWIQWIGSHSYNIYLWHYPILFLWQMR